MLCPKIYVDSIDLILESVNDSFIDLTQLNENDDSLEMSRQDFQSSSESKNTGLLEAITFSREKSRGPSIDLSNFKGKFQVLWTGGISFGN